jgi:peroxiredoxin
LQVQEMVRSLAAATLILTSLATAQVVPVALAAPVSGSPPRLTYMVPVGAESDDGADKVAPAMPDIGFADASGMGRRLSQFAGQVTIVTFWSSACAPCLKDLTALNQLSGSGGAPGILVLALSEDHQGLGPVRALLSRQNLPSIRPFLDVNGAAAQALGVTQLPSSVLLDKHGAVVQAITGPYPWTSPETIARLRLILAAP